MMLQKVLLTHPRLFEHVHKLHFNIFTQLMIFTKSKLSKSSINSIHRGNMNIFNTRNTIL